MRPRLGTTGWVIVVEVVALAAYFALPSLRAAAIRQQASSAATEIERICSVAATAHAKTGEWPEDGLPGRAPESLKALLPPNFAFDRGAYQIDWDQWPMSEGSESFSRAGEFAAVSVTARDPRFCRELADAMGERRLHFTLGDRVTFMISDPGM